VAARADGVRGRELRHGARQLGGRLRVITVAVLFTSTLPGSRSRGCGSAGVRRCSASSSARCSYRRQLGVIPLYIMVSRWFGWTNDLRAVVLPSLVSAFGVFFMRQYLVAALPVELIEAGRVDGASTWRLYWNIALPVARPAAAVLGLLTFITAWNDLFWPLIVLNSQNRRSRWRSPAWPRA
jgi:cellobiose transport system permease protein